MRGSYEPSWEQAPELFLYTKCLLFAYKCVLAHSFPCCGVLLWAAEQVSATLASCPKSFDLV
jgi:hypothetical protein